MKPIEGNIIADVYRSGGELPDRIKNAPELIFGLQLFLNAFFDLDTERSHAMGLTMIPRSSIVEYAKELALDKDGTDDMLYYVRQIDSANISHLASKMPKPKTGKP